MKTMRGDGGGKGASIWEKRLSNLDNSYKILAKAQCLWYTVRQERDADSTKKTR